MDRSFDNNMQPNLAALNKLIKLALIAMVVLGGLLSAGAAYIWFSGGSGQASAAIAAPRLELKPGDTRALFHLTPDQSEVRFIIDETLLGAPKTVVGVTNEVAGDLLVDFDSPENTQMGTIRVNVRTLTTDNEFRTRALRGQILQADRDEYEFAEFTPTALTGLPEAVTIGEPFTFQIAGKLTLHGVKRDVTFDATITPHSEIRLVGTAETTVRYADFGMSIPEAPGVADVSDDVILQIDFTAAAQ